jgi:nucleoside 2-deoxyribosyltransferase
MMHKQNVEEIAIPANEVRQVYLAGKIQENDWRHAIFRGLRNNRQTVRDGFQYCGPFFISCDHGCYHGPGEHGRGAGSDRECEVKPETRLSVVEKCRSWIDAADVVFCYVDRERAFGTLFELGYAVAKGKPIFLAVNGVDHEKYPLSGDFTDFGFADFWADAWFIRMNAEKSICCPDIQSAWSSFVSWHWTEWVRIGRPSDGTISSHRRSENGKEQA